MAVTICVAYCTKASILANKGALSTVSAFVVRVMRLAVEKCDTSSIEKDIILQKSFSLRLPPKEEDMLAAHTVTTQAQAKLPAAKRSITSPLLIISKSSVSLS